MRTEKLASMGRMSAAVAHEIRNPLAAIAQANALLDEDITDPRHKQLTSMVQQNALRLERIVEEVLNISRVGNRPISFESQPLALNDSVARICRDWAQQTGSVTMLQLNLSGAQPEVDFEPEHLRRVLVNLLDNARRYASKKAESIQVSTHVSSSGMAVLGVWSDSPPMEQSVEKHLFEPFFSSESRSSGLGLYICRELCEGHGALITYQRSQRDIHANPNGGNEFLISLRRSRSANEDSGPPSRPFIPWH
jgi:two-component system sensor histidine kinase PilS (NtrC family)